MVVQVIQVRKYAGSDGPVVVLHGGPGAAGSLAGLAMELAPDCEVWEPLQRRSGEVPLTVDRHVADLHDIAPDPATIVGHSWGAMLGLSYAASHPAAVRALALVGCGTYDTASRAEYERRIRMNLGVEGNKQKQELRAAIELAHDSAERDRLVGLIGTLNTEAQSFDVLPEDHVVTVDAAGHDETWRDVLRRQATGLEPQSFDAIVSPVLMLHGDDDPHPGTMIRETLLPHIPQLEYVGIPRCGHEPWRERHGREPFLAALRGWLRER
ncbi:MAG TPA: alpha/beta hydrolase [Acidimicrobiia bacterium]|nr:alpha/beta hydrolase [Acidimicrobiia bacterium]